MGIIPQAGVKLGLIDINFNTTVPRFKMLDSNMPLERITKFKCITVTTTPRSYVYSNMNLIYPSLFSICSRLAINGEYSVHTP